jgi:hypothetical protein
MPEIGTSGLMSGDGKRSVGNRPQATAPILDSTTLCENSEVGLARRTFASNKLNKKRTALSGAVEKKQREKTILRVLCSWTFSHSLDPKATSVAGTKRPAWGDSTENNVERPLHTFWRTIVDTKNPARDRVIASINWVIEWENT